MVRKLRIQRRASELWEGADKLQKFESIAPETHCAGADTKFSLFRDEVIKMIDGLENRVETLRKEAISLQDQRDVLLTRIDMLKNTDMLANLSEADKEEVGLTLKRINERLQVSFVV